MKITPNINQWLWCLNGRIDLINIKTATTVTTDTGHLVALKKIVPLVGYDLVWKEIA